MTSQTRHLSLKPIDRLMVSVSSTPSPSCPSRLLESYCTQRLPNAQGPNAAERAEVSPLGSTFTRDQVLSFAAIRAQLCMPHQVTWCASLAAIDNDLSRGPRTESRTGGSCDWLGDRQRSTRKPRRVSTTMGLVMICRRHTP
jgi:hypothetical protein